MRLRKRVKIIILVHNWVDRKPHSSLRWWRLSEKETARKGGRSRDVYLCFTRSKQVFELTYQNLTVLTFSVHCLCKSESKFVLNPLLRDRQCQPQHLSRRQLHSRPLLTFPCIFCDNLEASITLEASHLIPMGWICRRSLCIDQVCWQTQGE